MSVDTSLVTPFVGERYADGAALSRLIAPPYDVISQEARRRYAAADPHNIVHLILPEAAGDVNRYRAAAEHLAAWRAESVFRADSAPSQTRNEHEPSLMRFAPRRNSEERLIDVSKIASDKAVMRERKTRGVAN